MQQIPLGTICQDILPPSHFLRISCPILNTVDVLRAPKPSSLAKLEQKPTSVAPLGIHYSDVVLLNDIILNSADCKVVGNWPGLHIAIWTIVPILGQAALFLGCSMLTRGLMQSWCACALCYCVRFPGTSIVL